MRKVNSFKVRVPVASMSRVSTIHPNTRNLALDPLGRLALGWLLQAIVYVCMFVSPFEILPFHVGS